MVQPGYGLQMDSLRHFFGSATVAAWFAATERVACAAVRCAGMRSRPALDILGSRKLDEEPTAERALFTTPLIVPPPLHLGDR